jgi:hypothetical protein
MQYNRHQSTSSQVTVSCYIIGTRDNCIMQYYSGLINQLFDSKVTALSYKTEIYQLVIL